MKNHYKLFLCRFCCLLLFAPCVKLLAQDTTTYTYPVPPVAKSHIMAGLQVPLQYTVGYRYHFNDRVSAGVQAGFIGKPFRGFIVDAMEAFGMDKYLARVIRKSFQQGIVIGAGPNIHFGSNYLGVYGQYMHLRAGGISPADALSIHFKRDFSQFETNALPLFEFTMQSNLLNVGLLAGHRFRLPNSRSSLHLELSLSKVIASINSFASNRALVDQTGFARNLYSQLDEEIQKAYWAHGFLPTLNIYWVYPFRKGGER